MAGTRVGNYLLSEVMETGLGVVFALVGLVTEFVLG